MALIPRHVPIESISQICRNADVGDNLALVEQQVNPWLFRKVGLPKGSGMARRQPLDIVREFPPAPFKQIVD